MKPLKILHIVQWFPNPENEIEAVFIAKHIKALNKYCENAVLHLCFGPKNMTEKNGNYDGIPFQRIALQPIIDKWRVKEYLAKKFIRKYLRENRGNFDLVNFYIAYPNAIFIGKLKLEFPTLKFCISEQWSAYHEHFNLAEDSAGRKRIAAIFKHGIPLNVVSTALGNDIRNFAGLPELKFNVVANIVDDFTFNFKEKIDRANFTFCSINSWSTLKNPIVLIDAFYQLSQKYKETKLIIAGSGQLDDKISEHVKSLQLEDKITIKGRINKGEVAELLQHANVYCQSSNYETFSAICIEALACGTPVIATNIGGMKDFIHPENGILVDEMNANAWCNAMERAMLNYKKYNFKSISENCIRNYNEEKIGQHFYDIMVNIAHGK